MDKIEYSELNQTQQLNNKLFADKINEIIEYINSQNENSKEEILDEL